uniref:Uncharacterized protein n=1 Tax=Ditylum brightwellii TaxID=49249 RepID=A0A7S1ZB64_9STRA
MAQFGSFHSKAAHVAKLHKTMEEIELFLCAKVRDESKALKAKLKERGRFVPGVRKILAEGESIVCKLQADRFSPFNGISSEDMQNADEDEESCSQASADSVDMKDYLSNTDNHLSRTENEGISYKQSFSPRSLSDIIELESRESFPMSKSTCSDSTSSKKDTIEEATEGKSTISSPYNLSPSPKSSPKEEPSEVMPERSSHVPKALVQRRMDDICSKSSALTRSTAVEKKTTAMTPSDTVLVRRRNNARSFSANNDDPLTLKTNLMIAPESPSDEDATEVKLEVRNHVSKALVQKRDDIYVRSSASTSSQKVNLKEVTGKKTTPITPSAPVVIRRMNNARSFSVSDTGTSCNDSSLKNTSKNGSVSSKCSFSNSSQEVDFDVMEKNKPITPSAPLPLLRPDRRASSRKRPSSLKRRKRSSSSKRKASLKSQGQMKNNSNSPASEIGQHDSNHTACDHLRPKHQSKQNHCNLRQPPRRPRVLNPSSRVELEESSPPSPREKTTDDEIDNTNRQRKHYYSEVKKNTSSSFSPNSEEQVPILGLHFDHNVASPSSSLSSLCDEALFITRDDTSSVLGIASINSPMISTQNINGNCSPMVYESTSMHGYNPPTLHSIVRNSPMWNSRDKVRFGSENDVTNVSGKDVVNTAFSGDSRSMLTSV